MLSHSSTGVPVVDAQEDFLRARRAHLAARLVRRASVPRTLTETAVMPRGSARLEVVPLKAVVGTVEPTITFDARFRPASGLVRARWERIALAHRRGVSLLPIRVLQGNDGLLHSTAGALLGLGLGWNVSFVAATAELSERTEPWERARLLGFNDLVSGATGAGLTHVGGVALTAGGVAALAIAAVVLVTIPAVWILLGGPRRDASQF